MATLAFGAVLADSASAKNLLWELPFTNFPVKITGKSTVTTTFETVGGVQVKCAEATFAGEIGKESPERGTKFAHLFLTLLRLNKCLWKVGVVILTCQTEGSAGEEVFFPSLIGHLGLAHLGTNLTIPAVLVLMPKKFILCTADTLVDGAVIGEITNPKESEFVESYNFKFEQTAGKQKYTSFLLSLFPAGENPLMTGQRLEMSGGEPKEEAGLSGESSISTLKGEMLRLILD